MSVHVYSVKPIPSWGLSLDRARLKSVVILYQTDRHKCIDKSDEFHLCVNKLLSSMEVKSKQFERLSLYSMVLEACNRFTMGSFRIYWMSCRGN